MSVWSVGRWLAAALAVSPTLAADVRAAALTKAPTLVQLQQPTYPEESLAAGRAGDVLLVVELDARGAVTRVTVETAPDAALGEAARVALLASQFTPAEIDGKPAAIAFHYTFAFVLPVPVHVPVFAPASPAAAAPAPSADSVGSAPPAALTATFETQVATRRTDSAPASHTLTREELGRVPGAMGDALRTLESLPGVGRAPLSSGILVLRGSSPDESGVYVDGHRVPLLYHFGGGPSVLPMAAIGTLTVQTGSFGARYGRATAGIVEIGTRAGRTDGYHGSATVDLLQAGGVIEGPWGEAGSFRLGGRRSIIDALVPVVDDRLGDGPSLTVVPHYYDYNARADRTLLPGVELTFVAYGSSDGLAFASEDELDALPPTLDLRLASHRMNPRLSIELGHDWQLEVSPAASWLATHGETPYSFLGLTTDELALRTELAGPIGEGTTLRLGIDATRDHHVFSARLPGVPTTREFPSADPGAPLTDDVDGELTIAQVGTYAEAELLWRDLRITPGLRVDHAQYAGRQRTALDPRLSALWNVHDDVELVVGLGLYHRVPEPNEVSRATGNPGLDLERSAQASLGAKWRIVRGTSVDVQAYAKHMGPLTEATTKLRYANGELVPQRYTSLGEGRVRGAELMVQQQPWHGLSGWVSYSLSKSERRQGQDDWTLYARDQTHNVSALASYDATADLRFGARVRYVTGYPWTPVVDADFDSDTARFVPVPGDAKSERVPAFASLDLRVEKVFGERAGQHVIVFADVQNVTNRRNAEYFQYSFDYAHRTSYPGLPFLPSVGVEAVF